MTALFKNKMMVQASSLGPLSTIVDACAIEGEDTSTRQKTYSIFYF